MKSILISCAALAVTSAFAQGPISEPYAPVSGAYTGIAVPQSPDPLVAYRWANPKATDRLEVYPIAPKSVKVSVPARAKVVNPATVQVSGPCRLMFDFGQVNAGWLEFDAEELEGEVEMSISEYNEPAILNAGAQNPVKTAVPKRYGTTYRLELNKELYEGVRFGWIDIKKLARPVELKNIRLICQIKPTNYNGSFACSDTMLTRVWYTGAYDVKLNLLHDYFGAILMERSDRISWTGDAYPSQAASLVAFGNYDFVKKNLYNTSTQFNGITAYSLYWVLSLLDYCNYTGDRAMFDEMRDNLCAKLDTAYAHFDRRIHLGFNGWDERLGAGFEEPDCREAQYVYRMLSLHVWKACSEAFNEAGQKELAAKYRKYFDEKSTSFRLIPNVLNDMGLHSVAEGINAEFFSPKAKEIVSKRVFTNRQQRLSYSPFNQFFIINAMAKMGLHDLALNTIDDCWGGQVRYGGTTFFEVFRPSWNIISKPNDAPVNNQCGYTSLCHPWSAGVTKWLSEELLGIRPDAPGFATFTVIPYLSDRVRWVKGKVPTPYGPIEAAFDLTTGDGSLTVPKGTKATLAIPKAGRQIKSVTGLDHAKNKGEDENYRYFIGLSEGKYSFQVAYEGTIPTNKTETFAYTLTAPVNVDSLTKGAWKGRYGKLGYLLCNYDGIGRSRTKLPSFVDSVHFTKNVDISWQNSEHKVQTSQRPDRRALVSDSGSKERALGAITTNDPNACFQTMTADIHCNKRQTYRLSLYFVDWEKAERRSAIEIFDLETKELLMPLTMVRNYEDGKYLTFRFDRPVRVRINQVRGENAAVSAMFFD